MENVQLTQKKKQMTQYQSKFILLPGLPLVRGGLEISIKTVKLAIPFIIPILCPQILSADCRPVVNKIILEGFMVLRFY